MFPRRRRGALLEASAGAAISRESILFVLVARGGQAAAATAAAHLVPDGSDSRVLIGPRVFHRPKKEELPRAHPFA